MTVKVSAECLTIIADSNEVRELREELYQVKQVIRDMKQEALRQQLRDIKVANRNIKAALQGIAG